MKNDIIHPHTTNPRGEIPLHSKASNNFLLAGIFDFPPKSNLQAKPNIKPSSAVPPHIPPNIITERPGKSPLREIDFKKWLDLSIGQREQIQAQLASLPKPTEPNERGEKALKKLKAALDKSFAALLSKKDLGR
jgi:hypothetical protein